MDEENEKVIHILESQKGIIHRLFSEKDDTPLHIEALRGTVATATDMCKRGHNVNSRNNYNETPIFYAIKHSPEMVNLFLNNGASLNRKCNQYAWPLQEALLSGTEKTVQIIINKIFANKSEGHLRSITVQTSEETIKALLHHEEDLYLSGNDYPLLIFFAAKVGNLDLFRLVLDGCRKYLDSIKHQKRELPLNELNFDGIVDRTALSYAVWQQDAEVVSFLLNEGADVNCTTCNHYTPLHFAAYLENEEICKILLSFGAQMNPRDQRGIVDEQPSAVSPLYLVCGGKEFFGPCDADGFVRTQISSQPNFKPEPVFNLGIMKLLLQHRDDPNFADECDGMTPFLCACEAGHLEAVKLLLAFGANIWTCNGIGIPAIHYATCGGSFEIVDLLLERGFDINMESGEGETPLFFCMHNSRPKNYVKMIEYLADLGANINEVDSMGFNPLRCAANFNYPEAVDCFLELGGNYEVEFISADDNSWLNISQKNLIAFFALKEDSLGNDIGNYIRNEMSETTDIRQFFETCKLEIEKLKYTYILEKGKFLLYDFLRRDVYGAFRMIQNKEVKEVLTCEKFKNRFPCYEHLLRKRFERLEILEKTINAVIEFLHDYYRKFNLPILIIEMILSFFSSSDFRKFGRALSRRRA